MKIFDSKRDRRRRHKHPPVYVTVMSRRPREKDGKTKLRTYVEQSFTLHDVSPRETARRVQAALEEWENE